MPTEKTSNDVFAAAVPEDIDPSDPAQTERLLAELDNVAKQWVWRQWHGSRPIMVTFAESQWLITNKIEKVDDFQPAHDCAACLAGNDQMKAFLAENPGRWVAMANMTYTEIWP